MKKVERVLENTLFASRWLLAPFYIGLVTALLELMVKFAKELFKVFANIGSIGGNELIISVLTLVDVSLIANLLIIITFSGYESFVSKFDVDTHEDRPGWMGKVGFGAIKVKLIGSIVAISAIELLKVYIALDQYNQHEITWKVLIHITFVISGVLFALMDKLSSK